MAIESHALGERLSNGEVETLLLPELDAEVVLLEVTAGESLVSHVEEGKVVLLGDQISDVLPLLRSGVDSGGVMSTGVEHEDRSLRCLLDGGAQALEVEALGLWIIVWEGCVFDTVSVEEGIVDGPGRAGHVNGEVLDGVELLQELGTDEDGTAARKSLGTADSLFGDGLGTLSVANLGSQFDLGQRVLQILYHQ